MQIVFELSYLIVTSIMYCHQLMVQRLMSTVSFILVGQAKRVFYLSDSTDED